jgi:hypothetical protein
VGRSAKTNPFVSSEVETRDARVGVSRLRSGRTELLLSRESITIRRPDDWHVHLRDGEILKLVAPYTAKQFARAIIMPNLSPPVTEIGAAADYRERIWQATGRDFRPLMTCYLTDESDPETLAHGFNDDVWIAAKLYPAHATTNSAHGATDIRNIYPALERMQRVGMVLCVHGEVTDPEVDVFDREAVFIDRVLQPLIRDLPELKVVLEHITTAEAAAFVEHGSETIAATITPHHLMLNRNALFETRARVLLGRMAAEDGASFISGLLIGEDVRIGLAAHPGIRVVAIGRPDLTALYAAALKEAGVETEQASGERAFIAGAKQIVELIQ